MSYILGVSSFYHDSAAALTLDGEIISAVQEERFTRIKHDQSFPINSIKHVLKKNSINLSNVEAIVFYEKPFLKFSRIINTHIAFAPYSFYIFLESIFFWLKNRFNLRKIIYKNLKKIDENFNQINKIKFSEHHLSHAASSFFPSSFEESLILVADGVGEYATTTIGIGKKNKIILLEEINFPNSLGLLYSAFTQYLGFKVNSGEYKLMGLAPYGRPIYKEKIKNHLIDIKEDGSYRLNMAFFNYTTSYNMINKKFINLFGCKIRNPEKDKLNQFHMNIAASIQSILDETIIKICRYMKKKYNIENLCLSGGVALNCIVNSKIVKESIFKNIWIQPAAGDAGGAIGSALIYFYENLKNNRKYITDNMKGSYLGTSFNIEEIKNELNNLQASYEEHNEKEVYEIISKDISNGKAVGWFQGKMEFGPRALGNRSILADPRNDEMQKILNLKIKFRESFRPFAPAILEEHTNNFFDTAIISPYMLYVFEIQEQHRKLNYEDIDKFNGLEKLKLNLSTIPAVTHVDFSARLQTVSLNTNKKFYNLINSFYKKTGIPILINTSFNVRGEPIVNSIEDAYKCFMGTGLDILVLENYILYKENQNKKNLISYKKSFAPD